MKHYQILKEHLVNYVRAIKFWMLNPSSTGQSKNTFHGIIRSFRGWILTVWPFCLSSGNTNAHGSKNSNIVKYYYSLKEIFSNLIIFLNFIYAKLNFWDHYSSLLLLQDTSEMSRITHVTMVLWSLGDTMGNAACMTGVWKMWNNANLLAHMAHDVIGGVPGSIKGHLLNMSSN